MVTVAVLCPLFYRNYGYDSLYYVHYYIVTMVTISSSIVTLPLGIYIYLFHVIPHQILITRAVKLQHQFSKSRGFKNFPHVFFKVYHRHILSADFFKYDHK